MDSSLVGRGAGVVNGSRDPGGMTLRLATIADVEAVAALHAERIGEGFLVTLGPMFLRRLYRRIVSSPRAFVFVVDASIPDAHARSVCGFIAVAEDTGALYREFLLHDGVVAAVSAVRGIARKPLLVWETLRYGLRGGGDGGGGEVLATAVSADWARRGVGSRLVSAAIDELRRRGAESARVVTAVGNIGAVRAYERGGFRVSGLDEVHRGVAQQLLVWP